MGEYQRPGVRVLVVEDESIVAMDIERSLKRMGYQVAGVAQSGEEAVEQAGRLQPTIVFMDIQLKGRLNGIDAAREIRDRFEIPVIFLTAYSDEATLQRAKEAEPYGYLLKPFEESDLRTALEVGLHKHRVEVEQSAALGKALAESEEKYRLLVGNVKDYAIFLLDQGGHIASWNPGAEKIFGYSQEEVLGKEPILFFTREDREAGRSHRELLREAEQAGKLETETWRRRKDGSAFWASISITPMWNPKGALRGYSIVTQDVTERKKLVDDLKEAIRTRDEFLSIASHELRTPLTGLQLQLQLMGRLLRKLGIPEAGSKLDHSLAQCERQSKRIGNLIDELLDLTRIRLGKLSLKSEPVDLSELAREVLERIRLELGGIQISVHATGPARGHWDRGRIEQVLTNLLTNAAKYGEGKPVEVSVEAARDEVRLRVEDRGMGIPKELQKKIFERFERAVGSSKISGLGLGLYITRQIVEAHGGTIEVESEPGRGSVFTVRLPALARKAVV